MKLKLLSLLDQSTNLFDNIKEDLYNVEEIIGDLFDTHFKKHDNFYVGIKSRVKQTNSLKEKIIRNKIYNICENAEQVLDIIPDLVGFTIQCRFIADEKTCLTMVKNMFEISNQIFSQCRYDKNLYLDLRTVQPQLQQNGFAIYRLDGYYILNGNKYNFELQIKSLIHNFWADIEHQVVYKNNRLAYSDKFMKQILASINDNLEIVDNQLQIIYQQMQRDKELEQEIGMSEQGFKSFLAKSINDLYSLKMKECIGVSTNFKKCSGILSQYFYLRDFINYEHTQIRMMQYFEQFQMLKETQIDFTETIGFESNFVGDSIFTQKLGEFWQNCLNVDFEWHSFFVMLFAIEPGNNVQDFSKFIQIIKYLIVPNSFFKEKFGYLDDELIDEIIDKLLSILADAMIEYHKIDMIFEDKLLELSYVIQTTINKLSDNYINEKTYRDNIDYDLQVFKKTLTKCLNK